MSSETFSASDLTSPDGRFRLVEEADPRIDERLLPRLRLEDTTSGEVLFDMPNTHLIKAPGFRTKSVFLEFMHAGHHGLLEVTYADRTYIAERHDFPHPLSELPTYLATLIMPPQPVFATTGAIVRSILWLVGFIGVTGVFLYIALFSPPEPHKGWWVPVGIIFGAFSTWATWVELQTLLRRPRRK